LDKRKYALLGTIGPVIAYVFIGISIALSPWFSWSNNALSDLGHSVKSGVAPVFNLGLLLTGFTILVYAVTALKKHSRYTSICLSASAFLLQSIATFNEAYGFLHYAVSVLFFVSLGVALIVYAIERKSSLTVAAFIIGFGSWILFWSKIYSAGVAVPEVISSTAVTFWLVLSSLRIYFSNSRTSLRLPHL